MKHPWAILIAGTAAIAAMLSSTPALAQLGLGQWLGRTLSEEEVRGLASNTARSYFPRVDPAMLVAMAWIESSFRPDAVRYEPHLDDGSTGLMQTLVNTARWLWRDMGARLYPEPDGATLLDPGVSMYFGAAYVNWLRSYGGRARSEEWIVRAYNGGPGWEKASASSLSATANHWRKYQAARQRFG